MRVVVQRVKEARVVIKGKVVGEIGKGILLLVGFGDSDTYDDIRYMVEKILSLRVFPISPKKHFEKSIIDIDGDILIVSQFTLYGNCKKGRRPSFDRAAPPDEATEMYNTFIDLMKKSCNLNIQTGIFGAMMEVELVNDGPVTLLLESK